MTNKNKITTSKTAIMASAIIGLMLFSPTLILPNISAQTPNTSQDCTDEVGKQMYANSKIVNHDKAYNLASNHDELKTMLKGYDYKYAGLGTSWTFDSNCNVTLKALELAFILSNKTGPVKTINVIEDPTATKIMKTEEHKVEKEFFIAHNSNIWSGYEFSGNAQASANVLYVRGQWTQPTPQQPSPGKCSTPHCDIATWVGLSDTLGASSSDLAQAGTDATMNCGVVGCPITYEAAYEFLPDPPIHVSTLGVSGGHSMTFYVINEAQYGGFTTLYDIQMIDSTSNTSFLKTGISYTRMPGPTYGDTIVERALQTDIGSRETIAKYSNSPAFSITGRVYYGNAFHGIIDPYTNGWYRINTMINSATPNITTGAVSSSSAFTETYNNSDGT